MNLRRFAAEAGALAAVSALAAGAMFLRGTKLQTSLYDLAGDAAASIPQAVRNASGNLAPVVVTSSDFSKAAETAGKLAGTLPAEDCEKTHFKIDGSAVAETLEFCRANRSGLAAPAAARLLETPEGRAKLARRAEKRAATSILPPLFPPAEDPFLLADGFAVSVPASLSGWSARGGFLAAEKDGECHILLVMVPKKEVLSSLSRLVDFKKKTDAAIAAAVSPGVVASPCGIPMHTAESAERCRNQIGILGAFSALFIVLLSALAFKSAKWICHLAFCLAFSAATGALALFLACPAVHIMTLVFGTTLLGLVTDYAFHRLLAPSGDSRRIAKALCVSFATTAIGLAPLAFSSIPALRQSAVFLLGGLAGSLFCVLFLFPRGAAPRIQSPASVPDCEIRSVKSLRPQSFIFRFRFSVLLHFSVLLLAAAVLLPVRVETKIPDLYVPSSSLVRAERILADLSGGSGGDRGVMAVSGCGDLEELLEKEAAAGLPDSVSRLSRIMPPLSQRRRTAALAEKLYEEKAGEVAEFLGIERPSPPPPPKPWRMEDVPPAAAQAFIRGDALLVPSTPEPEGPLPEGVSFCRPVKILEDALCVWTRETKRRLVLSLAAMALAMAAIFRRRVFAAAAPSAAAIAFSLSAIALSGRAVNMFHLLAAFMLAGMCVDYAVFTMSGRGSFKSVVCSFLTSMAGFGALAFVSFPVVGAFGAVMGLGLPAGFAVAMATGAAAHRSGSGAAGAPQGKPGVEKAASPLGLKILWTVYRVAGLRALRTSASCVAACAWFFSPGVRKSCPSLRKAVSFARMLADKTAAMSGGRSRPRVVPDGSPGTARFVSDVASGKGVFVLSSHLGCIEALSALGDCPAVFHAWMDTASTKVFNSFYLARSSRPKVEVHPVSSFGPETVFEAGDRLDAGDCVLMAADRTAGRVMRVETSGGEAFDLAEGAFRLAAALDHPVYFAACVAVRGEYRAIARPLSGKAPAMAKEYAEILSRLVREHPGQWFAWNGGEGRMR